MTSRIDVQRTIRRPLDYLIVGPNFRHKPGYLTNARQGHLNYFIVQGDKACVVLTQRILLHFKNQQKSPDFRGFFGGEGGIRTHVPGDPDHLISSQRRYDRFGTSPERRNILPVSSMKRGHVSFVD